MKSEGAGENHLRVPSPLAGEGEALNRMVQGGGEGDVTICHAELNSASLL